MSGDRKHVQIKKTSCGLHKDMRGESKDGQLLDREKDIELLRLEQANMGNQEESKKPTMKGKAKKQKQQAQKGKPPN